MKPGASAKIEADYRELAQILVPLRQDRMRIGLTNGCFDIVHVGHIRLLREAGTCCDTLIVALNCDAQVSRLKGAGRPLVPLEERMEVIAAIEGVDFVTSFPEPRADELIRCLRPGFLIKGTDRCHDTLPELDTLTECNVQLLICGDPKSHSSSALVHRLGALTPERP